METHRSKGDDVLACIQAIDPSVGDFARMFAGNRGPIVNKWHHYIPIYDRYFSRFRGTEFRFLEKAGVTRPTWSKVGIDA